MQKHKEKVYRIKASPFFWRLKAEELSHAAEILWPKSEERQDKIHHAAKYDTELDFKDIGPNIFPTFLALLGFSMECLFKAAIIRDNKNFVSNGVLSKKLKSHNLLELAKTAKITLTKNERIFCKQAHDSMLEYRYPIYSELAKESYSIEIGGHCKEVFTELYERLYPTLGKFSENKNVKISFK